MPDLTPVQYCGDYAYKVYNDSSVEIVEYKGLEPDIIIPEELDGNRVTSIGDEAFAYYKMDSLIVPEGDQHRRPGFRVLRGPESLFPAGRSCHPEPGL